MNTKSIFRHACTFLVFGTLVSSPMFVVAQQPPQTPAIPHNEQPSDRMEQVASDAWKEGKLETIYLFNRHLNNFTIDPEVSGNTVVLNGIVESPIDKALAEQIALGVEGITSVTNLLAIESSMDTSPDRKRDFLQIVEDVTLTAEVKTKLFADGGTKGLQINVDTQEKTVTLSGTVDSASEKDLAGRIANEVEGVVAVHNNLVVSN